MVVRKIGPDAGLPSLSLWASSTHARYGNRGTADLLARVLQSSILFSTIERKMRNSPSPKLGFPQQAHEFGAPEAGKGGSRHHRAGRLRQNGKDDADFFQTVRLNDQVPENHLLRLIEKHIRFEFVRERLKDSYSETGRPSIDPELLLRILLIGYLYGVTSERKLVEELRMHLAWRWFTGLGFDQEIPHHSTFSKNRHGRFQESKPFEQPSGTVRDRDIMGGHLLLLHLEGYSRRMGGS
jgi:transposase